MENIRGSTARDRCNSDHMGQMSTIDAYRMANEAREWTFFSHLSRCHQDTTPPEILLIIFSYLQTGSDVVRASQVCRNWRQVILSEPGFRTIRALRFLNAIRLTVLHKPLSFHCVEGVGRTRPDLQDLVDRVSKVNTARVKPLAMEHELEVLFDHSLQRIQGRHLDWQMVVNIVKFFCHVKSFGLAMRKVNDIGIDNGLELTIQQISRQRAFYEIAKGAHRCGLDQIFAQASVACEDFFHPDLNREIARQKEVIAKERLENELRDLVHFKIWNKAIELYPFVTDLGLRYEVILEVVDHYLQAGDKDIQVRELLGEATDLMQQLDLSTKDLMLKHMKLCVRAGLPDLGEVILARFSLLYLPCDRLEQIQVRDIYAEACIVHGDYSLAIQLFSNLTVNYEVLISLLCKYGRIREAEERIYNPSHRYLTSAMFLALGQGLLEYNPDRAKQIFAVEIPNFLKYMFSSRILSEEAVTTYMQAAYELLQLGDEDQAKVLCQEITNLVDSHKSSSFLHLADLSVALAEGLATLGELGEARKYFRKAVTFFPIEFNVKGMGDDRLEKIARAQIKWGFFIDGQITFDRIWKRRMKSLDQEGMVEASFQVGTAIMNMVR